MTVERAAATSAPRISMVPSASSTTLAISAILGSMTRTMPMLVERADAADVGWWWEWASVTWSAALIEQAHDACHEVLPVRGNCDSIAQVARALRAPRNAIHLRRCK